VALKLPPIPRTTDEIEVAEWRRALAKMFTLDDAIDPTLIDGFSSGSITSNTLTLDSDDTGGNVDVIFGTTVNKHLRHTGSQFQLNDDLLINADITINVGSITSASGAISFGNENLLTTGTFAAGATTITGTMAATTVTGVNVTSGADPGHTHTGASLGSVDISDDTNLAVTSPIVLTDDTLSLSFSTNNTWTGTFKHQNAADSTTAFQILDADGGTSVFNVDTTNERIGIGIDAPTVTFDVAGNSDEGAYRAVTTKTGVSYITGNNFTYTDSSARPWGAVFSAVYEHTGAGTVASSSIFGSSAILNINGSHNNTFAISGAVNRISLKSNSNYSNITSIIGTQNTFQNWVANTGDFTITSYKGFYAHTANLGGGGDMNITDAYQIYADAFPSWAGTITNAYGLYLEEQTAGGTINNEIFIAGAGEIFFRDQAIHIGSLTDGHLDLTADVSIDLNSYVYMPTIRSGATQAAAGASASEVWKTSGHATLPDNVLMIGV
jgi:hypothetical protein